jgi:hypothetical protein
MSSPDASGDEGYGNDYARTAGSAVSAPQHEPYTRDRTIDNATESQVALTVRRLSPQRRRALENAIRALRAMPPAARERQLESVNYKDFSVEERKLLDFFSEPSAAPRGPAPPAVPRPSQQVAVAQQ